MVNSISVSNLQLLGFGQLGLAFLSLKDMSTNLKARHYPLFYLLLSFIPIGLDFYYIALAIGKTLDLLTDISSVLRGNLVSFL